MALLLGITGAPAPEPDQPDNAAPESPVEAVACPELESAEPLNAEPGPGLEERSFSLVGRALQFVMKHLTPGAWQSVVQHMADQMPASIELEPADGKAWEDEKRHQELLEELHDQGFVDAGVYRAASIDSKLHLLINEAYDIRAVLYERPESGVVLDLVTLYGDGTGVTYVNRDKPGYEQSPLHPNIYMGNVPVFELLDTCLHERPKKATLPESPGAVARLTELEYEFGAKRLRGEPVNPIEIAEAYLEVIERLGAPKKTANTAEWNHALAEVADSLFPALEGESAAASEPPKAIAAGKKS